MGEQQRVKPERLRELADEYRRLDPDTRELAMKVALRNSANEIEWINLKLARIAELCRAYYKPHTSKVSECLRSDIAAMVLEIIEEPKGA